ncbi:hypothetical protein PR202_gb27418 [Eleusine coracana subsp. coracana]|uniref:F-box associated beta-propeller type 1 domain-containing protein n=1 Tax=Eleusine coracana subsp. coracana TaxID=191504 RepID=A0AAV5FUP5_ELECO|nr:hypothetical protein PR202_gb27418 [Eleusine coracana subsp. coracana]
MQAEEKQGELGGEGIDMVWGQCIHVGRLELVLVLTHDAPIVGDYVAPGEAGCTFQFFSPDEQREIDYHLGEWGQKTAFSMGFYKHSGDDVAELVHGEDFPGGFAELARPMHCDGMILICTREEGLMVCNPATREFVSLLKGGQIQNLPLAVGFGRDPCTGKYKVVRFFFRKDVGTPNNQFSSRFEVLTLGSNTWRRVGGPPCMIDRPNSIHIRGFIYWAIRPQRPPWELLRFSLADETFSMMPYPPGRDDHSVCFDAFESELCCISYPKKCEAVEIWTCSGTNTDMPMWTRRFTLRVPQDMVVPSPTGALC